MTRIYFRLVCLALLNYLFVFLIINHDSFLRLTLMLSLSIGALLSPLKRFRALLLCHAYLACALILNDSALGVIRYILKPYLITDIIMKSDFVAYFMIYLYCLSVFYVLVRGLLFGVGKAELSEGKRVEGKRGRS